MDANYNFIADKIYQIKIKSGAFIFPDVKNYDTLILKITVQNENIFKYFTLPFLQLSTKNFSEKYFLERRNCGIRYLDITNCKKHITDGDKIFLINNKLIISNDIELLCFNNKIDDNAKVLIIAPHPDDAELAAFNFYRNHESTIVTITAGDDGPNFYAKYYPDNQKQQYVLKGKMRVFDSITTPILGNVSYDNAINLGYFDNTIFQMWQNKDKAVISNYTKINNVNFFRSKNCENFIKKSRDTATWDNLVADLIEIITQIQPNIIVLPHQDLDSHLDHKYITKAVTEATKNSNLKNFKYFFYVTHATFSERYPYGPKNSMSSLPFNSLNLKNQYKVFSSLLNSNDQIEKEMILNTMHDLRYPPNHICSFTNIIKHLLLPKFKEMNIWHDYYRRFVRANEIFLVEDI